MPYNFGKLLDMLVPTYPGSVYKYAFAKKMIKKFAFLYLHRQI